MFKSAIALAAAAPLMAAPALAGPYVNVLNASWTGDNYTGATTDIHLLRRRSRHLILRPSGSSDRRC